MCVSARGWLATGSFGADSSHGKMGPEEMDEKGEGEGELGLVVVAAGPAPARGTGLAPSDDSRESDGPVPKRLPLASLQDESWGGMG